MIEINEDNILQQCVLMRDRIARRVGNFASDVVEPQLREGVDQHAAKLERNGFKQAGQELRRQFPQNTEKLTDTGVRRAVSVVTAAIKTGKLTW